MVRCNRDRPDNAFLIVILLDGGLRQAGHTDAIATHHERHLFARFVGKSGTHRLGVFATELKNMANFNAPRRFKHLTRIVKGAISGLSLTYINLKLR